MALAALMAAVLAQVAGANAQTIPSAATTNLPIAPSAAPLARQAPSSNPATIKVTTTTDGGPGSLRQAIADANAGDTITVPAGTYTLHKGELLVEKSLTIAGAGSAVTTIDANGSSRAFNIIGRNTELAVTISGVTVTNGRGTRSSLTEAFGGAAINSEKTALTVLNDVFRRNISTAHAQGAVAGGTIENVLGSLTMIGTTVTENLSTTPTPEPQQVGGVVFGGAIDVEQGDSVTIERSAISGNVVQTPGGFILGAGTRIFAHASRIVGSTFNNNRGEALGKNAEGVGRVDGGGMLLVAIGFPNSTNLLDDDTIAGNVANADVGFGEGGGILIDAITPVHVSRTTFDSNRVDGGPESIGGNVLAATGETFFSHSSVIHGVGPAGSENCGIFLPEEEGDPGAKIISEGFNRESTDQCGFHAVGDEVNVG